MEKVEIQPDMFGGEDTYYLDGRKALTFMDVYETMEEIAPDLAFTEQQDINGLYHMQYTPQRSGVVINKEKVDNLRSQLEAKFGKGNIYVRMAQAQYAPELKSVYVIFADLADAMDEEENQQAVGEAVVNNFKKGDRVRIKNGAENFPGEEGVITNKRFTALSNTPFYAIELDSGNQCDVIGDNLEIVVDEGIKDTLKSVGKYAKGALAGTAMAASLATGAHGLTSDPYYDGAQRPFEDSEYAMGYEEPTSYPTDLEGTELRNGDIEDEWGNQWTQEEWEKLQNGIDPFGETNYTEVEDD